MQYTQGLLKTIIDRGTYKEDYPWSQSHLDDTIRRIVDDCYHGYVTVVRPSCELNFSAYPCVMEFNGTCSETYYILNHTGDPDKSCRFRMV